MDVRDAIADVQLLTPQQPAQQERREREKEVSHDLEDMDVREAIDDNDIPRR
jgi:hypothetical protein